MNYKELAKISQAQINALMKTIESLQSTLESQNVTIRSLSCEIKQLRELLLEKDRNAQKIVSKLNGLARITLPSKIEKCKIENPTEKTAKD